MLTNSRLILHMLGELLLILCAFMLLPVFVAIGYDEDIYGNFLVSSAITAVMGVSLVVLFRKHDTIVSKQDSYIIVASVWVFFTLFGMLPYSLCTGMPIIDAMFESMSGFTTTGSTVFPNIDIAPRSLLLWRSLTQWIGGMGIITLSAVLLPALGIGGMQMFTAEASINRSDRFHPKINEVARYSMAFYVGLTLLEVLCLYFGDMPLFDAVCHSLSTLSTGGFSPRMQSVGYYNSAYIEYVVIIFMFLGGANFTLFYAAMFRRWDRIKGDEESRAYLITILLCSIIVTCALMNSGAFGSNIESSFRHSLFHIVSVITSTGFTTDNYTLWPPVTATITVLLMVTGTCTSSTSGGLKLMRILITLRHIKGEFKRMIHPTAVVPVKYNGKAIPDGDLRGVSLFVLFYFVVMIIGVLLLSMDGLSFEDAFGLGANSLGDIGISIGSYGPNGDIASLSVFSKFIMIVLMLLGRLEIFTIILLFAPSFWKR